MAPFSKSENGKKHTGTGKSITSEGAFDVTPGETSEPGFVSSPPPNEKSPLQTAGWFSRLFFHQVTPLLLLGARRQLQPEDLWEVEECDQAEPNYRRFAAAWHTELLRVKALPSRPDAKKHRPSLYRVLLSLYWRDLVYTGVLQGVSAACTVVGPFIMRAIIVFLADQSAPTYRGYALAAAFALVPMFGSICLGHAFLRGFRLGMRVRSLITMAVYRKSLRLSTAVRQDPAMTQGRIVTLMSIDGQSFVEGIGLMHYAWISPSMVIAIMALLSRVIGAACLSGLGVMLLILPVSGLVAAVSIRWTFRQKQQTDQRVAILSEIMQGIRIIKLFAWEPSFMAKVYEVRAREVKFLRKIAILRAIDVFVTYGTPMLVSIATFGTYMATGGQLVASVVFPTISLFHALTWPLTFLPYVISNIVKMNIARTRLVDFMLTDEAEGLINTVENGNDVDPNIAIELKDASFHWLREKKVGQSEDKPEESTHIVAMDQNKGVVSRDPTKEKKGILRRRKKKKETVPFSFLERGFELKALNVTIRKGEFVAIVGAVGQGKSSLLSAIIGDMERDGGSVAVHGSMAYAAQVPWIVNGTVRDNIVFGREFDAGHYAAVLRACALLPDLGVLRGGDMAEIGERGINLSGGQKQRISIARAAYSRAELVLLDDPLSAVDAHVGRHLLTKCLAGLLAHSTRLLVTNQLHVLPHTTRVIVMKEGRIAEMGTYEQLMAAGGELFGLMGSYGHAEEHGSANKPQAEKEEAAAADGSLADGRLVAEEDRQAGYVDWRVYVRYIKAAGGITYVVPLVVTLVGAQVLFLLTDAWMALWTSNVSGRVTDLFGGRDDTFYLAIYCALGMATQVFFLTRSLTFVLGGVRAAVSMHKGLLANLLRAKVSFFDSTPVGRIINRFSKDMDMLDQYTVQSLESMLVCLAEVFGILALVCMVFPWFLIGFFPILGVYFWVQTFFRKTSRELQRIESTTRSPIYVQFSETLAGVSTIRCYGDQGRFVLRNTQLVDLNNRSFVALQICNRWLQVRLEALGLAITATVAALAVAQKQHVNPSLSALVLTYCLGVVMQMNWATRMAAELETRMTGVERILEYSDQKLQEAPVDSAPDKKPPPDWPSRGEVRFEGLTMRYRPELPLVLDNVSLTVHPGKKVGIVGRTGSGKSTLMNALFRMAEAEGGRIVIDGVDTASLGLGDLRRGLAIIPQDPVLFSQKLGGRGAAFGAVGGVRFNLDPLGRHDDAALWGALEAAQLGATVRGLGNGLDGQVAEGGANFSVGQRQLLCLARALLRRPRVLVLDEATANVDTDTDTAIQRTLRTQLHHATVLTIAHRLHTVMDADKVLVMDKGRVAEYGRPRDLLMNPNGMLTALVNDTGPASAARLRAIANGQLSVFDALKDPEQNTPTPAPPTTELTDTAVISDEQQFETLVLDSVSGSAEEEGDGDSSRVAIRVEGEEGSEDQGGSYTNEDGPVDVSQVIEHMAPVMYSMETRSVRSMRLLGGEDDGVSVGSHQ